MKGRGGEGEGGWQKSPFFIWCVDLPFQESKVCSLRNLISGPTAVALPKFLGCFSLLSHLYLLQKIYKEAAENVLDIGSVRGVRIVFAARIQHV